MTRTEKRHRCRKVRGQLIGEVLTTPSDLDAGDRVFFHQAGRGTALYFWGPKYVAESLGSDASDKHDDRRCDADRRTGGRDRSGYISDKLFQSRRAPVVVLSLLLAAGVLMLGLTPDS